MPRLFSAVVVRPVRPVRAVCVPAIPLLLSALLSACGGGGASVDQNSGSVVVVPPPVVSLRGTLIGSATLVPVAGLNTLEPAVLTAALELAQKGSSAITGTPTCSITTYTVHYHTIDSLGADTDASTAVMVPSGSNAACQGGRPVLLYAHGTSVQKSTDMANLAGTEARLVAAMFAAQGYIVVAPNYAGYNGSALGYHAYLDAAQQSADMVDALRAARLSWFRMNATANSRLMVGGYSQGGYVALATQRAMQTQYAGEFNVTAAVPMSGPYALTQFGDAIFNGAPTMGSAAFLPMLINAAQHANAGIYTSTADVYEPKYASGIENLLPGTQGLGDLVAAGKLPNDVLFAQDSLPQTAGYASFFGADHLLKTSYRNSYLADLKANPCNVTSANPLNCAPAQPLRRWLLKNDMRNYVPAVPLLLCGGNQDPLVPFQNTDAASAYFSAKGVSAGTLTVLDVDDSALLGPYRNTRAEFAAAKLALKLSSGDQAVRDSYHAGLVAPFCMREARNFFDSAPNR